MRQTIHFGIKGELPSGFSEEEIEKSFIEFGNQLLSVHFIEIVPRPFDPRFTLYEIKIINGKTELSKSILPGNDERVKLAESVFYFSDPDDWAVIFECDAFLPNMKHGDEYCFINGSELMVSPLENGIKKIEFKMDEYAKDYEMPADELNERIDQLQEYLNIFTAAKKNNFIVKFSA